MVKNSVYKSIIAGGAEVDWSPPPTLRRWNAVSKTAQGRGQHYLAGTQRWSRRWVRVGQARLGPSAEPTTSCRRRSSALGSFALLCVWAGANQASIRNNIDFQPQIVPSRLKKKLWTWINLSGFWFEKTLILIFLGYVYVQERHLNKSPSAAQLFSFSLNFFLELWILLDAVKKIRYVIVQTNPSTSDFVDIIVTNMKSNHSFKYT